MYIHSEDRKYNQPPNKPNKLNGLNLKKNPTKHTPRINNAYLGFSIMPNVLTTKFQSNCTGRQANCLKFSLASTVSLISTSGCFFFFIRGISQTEPHLLALPSWRGESSRSFVIGCPTEKNFKYKLLDHLLIQQNDSDFPCRHTTTLCLCGIELVPLQPYIPSCVHIKALIHFSQF